MSNGKLFEATYSCTCTGGEFVPFGVRWRRRDEDIAHWIENAVRPAMTRAHSERSPMCTGTKADLKLPIDEAADGIGKRRGTMH